MPVNRDIIETLLPKEASGIFSTEILPTRRKNEPNSVLQCVRLLQSYNEVTLLDL